MIQTVIGTVEASDLGNVLFHEHIGCISNDLMHIFGEKWLDKEVLADFAVDILKELKLKHGLGLLVDGTPIDLGRDALLLRAVSLKSGIPIVASTGLYHYPSLYTDGNSEEEIAAWFIKEFEEGMEGTGIKPGILKVASDFSGITEDNKKRLSAMAIAQRETKLPIYVHSIHSADLVEKQLEILLQNIKETEKIIIGHAALNPDARYLAKILDRGCYICMDQCHCYPHNKAVIAETLVKLCQKGYTDKILLANDYCIHSDFGNNKTNGLHLTPAQHADGLGYVLDLVYKEYIAKGGNDEAWETMICKNAMDILDH